MPQYVLEIREMRSSEDVHAGHMDAFIRVERDSPEECEAVLPEALKLLGERPYVARVLINMAGEPDEKTGLPQRDMFREIATNTDKELRATFEVTDSGYRRITPPDIPTPVPTKADQIAELERVKADAEAQLAVLKAEEAP